MTDDLVTRLDILPYVYAGRRRIAVATMLGLLGGFAFGFYSPKWYTAAVSVVPTTTSKSPVMGAGAAAAALGNVDLPIDLGGGGSDVERIAAIFQSNSVVDAVITKFGLIGRYRVAFLEDARIALLVHCSTRIDKKPGVVTVACEDTSPQVAADMTTYFAVCGDKVSRRISTSSAGEERRFLETRLGQARADLDKASQSLRDFQQRNKVISLPEQAKAVVASLATLRGEMLEKQIQLAYVDSFSSNDESTSGQLRAQVSAVRGRLKALEGESVPSSILPPVPPGAGKPSSNAGAGGGGSIFPPAMSIPLLQYELEQHLREQKMQEVLVNLLAQRYEVARINEARDTSTFQILDNPVVPTKKTRPRVSLSIALGALLGFALGFALTVFGQLRRWVRTERKPADAT